MMTKQKQTSGENSTSYQAGRDINNYGMTYTEAKEIITTLFKENFLKLSEEAYEVVIERASVFVENFLKELLSRNEEGIAQAKNPSFQSIFYNAQKFYACSGDEEMRDLLINMLVERTKHENRDFEQIVLDEAIITIPKLTDQQIATLSVSFLLVKSRFLGVKNIDAFIETIEKHFKPFINKLTKNPNCYLHLAYASCGDLAEGKYNIYRLMINSYKGLFSNGFSTKELEEIAVDIEQVREIVGECMNDSEKIQLAQINDEVTKEIATKNDISLEIVNKLIKLNNQYLMKAREMKIFLESKSEHMKNLNDIWDNSDLCHFRLTSVGMAIAHANIKKELPNFSDLDIWIN